MISISEYNSIFKSAISQWEIKSKKNFKLTVEDMAAKAIMILKERRDYFSREIAQIENSENSRRDFIDTIEYSLSRFIMKTADAGINFSDDEITKWEHSASILIKMRNLYRQISPSQREIINTYLELDQTDPIPDNLNDSLLRAWVLTRRRGIRPETRGRKTLPLSVFVIVLANNIEEAFDRKLARSYDTSRDRQLGEDLIGFVNPDAILIYHVSRVVFPDATVEKVKHVLKNHYPKSAKSSKEAIMPEEL